MQVISRSLIALGALAALSLALPVSAQYIYTGTTTGAPTWNRPVANGSNPPTPPVSGVGTAVHYSALQFQVDTAGAYNFLSLGTAPTNWDNYTFLYQNSFNPASQFTNVIIGNDDFPTIGRSGFNGVNLTTGTNYFFVTTAFSNSDFGAFRNTIGGAGNVIIPGNVPEPGSIALLVGMATVSSVVLRRRKK